jgi:hypothetical protein
MIASVTMDYSAMVLKPAIHSLVASREAILVMEGLVMKTLIVVLSAETESVKTHLVSIAVIAPKTVRVTVSKESAVEMEFVRSLKKKEAPARKIVDKMM